MTTRAPTHAPPGAPALTPIPERLLLGAGPSPVPDSVLAALAQPTIGHLDPAFVEVMEETVGLLRATFDTANRATLPLSTTGSGGMDALVVNFVEPGDRVVCGVNGLFGERMAEALTRAGADLVRVEAPWGRALAIEELVAAAEPGLRAMVVIHGETSTGVCQPLDGLAAACRERDALLLVDCVTSLSGQPLSIDGDGIDAAFGGTQKCLNCPPGLSPFTAGPRALERLGARASPPRSWYLDLSLLGAYWLDPDEGAGAGAGMGQSVSVGTGQGAGVGRGEGETVDAAARKRSYHHTAPVNLVYALREALALVIEEGLEARWERHRRAHEALRRALGVFGFERLARAEEALAPLLALRVPEGLDEADLRARLLARHGIEVSGGLGPLAGRVWRVGVMGVGARPEPQARLIEALAAELGLDPAEALAELEAGGTTSRRRPGKGATARAVPP
jgi:alanine-glyoxylate transaminase/serine-glyoxylate transaminase/serine-pyruvate transaminase